jgi:hypothetical protein
MSKRGGSLWFLRIAACCVGAMCHSGVWLDGSCQEVWAASPTIPDGEESMIRVPIDAQPIALAPYVWKRTGARAAARAEATMPGAYLKIAFQGSSSLGLLVDGTANNGCPAAAMPVVDHSVDEGPFKSVQLERTGEVYALPLAEALDPGVAHRLELHFRSACLGPGRWQESTVHLRIAGIELEPGGSLLDCAERAKRAIGFGDSITEGVCNEGSCAYYTNLLMNNARTTWFPLVCAGLSCEYGQLGTGGQGMVRPIEIPPLPQTWDHYDAATSRLTGELLLPEPDYVFCAMGTNDFRTTGDKREQIDITESYTHWLAAVRKACPHALCFCVVPPLGWHATEIAAAVQARKEAGDDKVYLIDTAPVKAAFHESHGTELAPDGVHPSVYGNAMLATLIAVEVQKILDRQ